MLSMITRRTPLQSFLTVATHGTVHEAARQLHLTQPAVTRQIKALEEELGGALFTRGVRGMELTRFGETFLHYARQMDQTLRYALNELQGISAGRTGSLRIGAGPAWAYTIVPDAVAELYDEFPSVSVEITTRLSDYYRMLEAGQLDMLIAELPEDRLAGFEYEKVLTIQRHVFARRGHPLARRKKIAAAELLDYPWITFRESIYGPVVMEAYFAKEGLKAPDAAVATSSFQTGFRLMRQRDYLMMLPETIRATEAEWQIAPLHLAGTPRAYDAGMIYRPELTKIRPYARFRELIVEFCAAQSAKFRGRGPQPSDRRNAASADG